MTYPPSAPVDGPAGPPQGGPAVPPQGAVPGAVPPGAVPPPPPIPGFPAEQKPKKSAKARILGIVGTILVVLVVIGLKSGLRSLFSDDPMADAKVGACVTAPADFKDTEVVECSDAKAGHTVAGRVPNVSKAAFDADAQGVMCTPFPDTEAALWIDGEDVALCLAPIKK